MTQLLNQPFAANRRQFLAGTSSAFAALIASGCTMNSGGPSTSMQASGWTGYGPLMPDPEGVLDLPEGFSYRVVSKLGDAMSDGGTVPDKADGMGCFDLGDGKLALVRNHEMVASDDAGAELTSGFGTHNGKVLPGGTTTIVLDAGTLAVENEYRSLAGTIRNCSGGITPWGSWLTCEEAPTGPGQRYGDGLARNHGWVFEVPADAGGLVDPVPLTEMGRFNHEAACVDPATGIVYMTEDANDSLFYRFIPKVPGQLAQGGKLQALMLTDGIRDSRNWEGTAMAVGEAHAVGWIDMDDVESPNNDLRQRGAAGGGLLIARGEGLHMGLDEKGSELYICSTSGGAAGLGQIFRLRPAADGGADQFDLFFESTSPDQFNFGDNLCVGPNGHLVVCEDQYTDVVANHLRGLTPAGEAYPLGFLRLQTEPAGACFSPDGKTMFVNAYSPTMTLAVTGPWAA